MKIVLTGGGTAGHVYPAINVGLYMQTKHQAELYYIGNHQYIEAQIAMQHHIPFYSIPSRGLDGENPLEKYASFAFQNSRGTLKAIKLLREIKPDLVFATGGFVSAPVLAACQLLKIPYFIHEQNSVTGKVNRLFQEKARRVFYSFPLQENTREHYTGNPVRFKERLVKNGEKVVFVGGSGGSAQLNQAAIAFAQAHPTIPCMLLTGKALYDTYVQQTTITPIANLELVDYAEDMLEIYKQANIMVCRSGSGTIFELANLSIPTVLIPLPTSADNHQQKNAQFFAERQASLLVEEGQTFQANLDLSIESLWSDTKTKQNLKKQMEKLSQHQSEKKIAKHLLAVLPSTK